MKNVYFLSDAHLGSLAIDHSRMHERRLVRFLDSIKNKAAAIYLLGDMFDFWYEFKYVVPRGYTRFLGKLSELSDMGVEIHYFTGNHDIWAYDYLEKECGVILHKNLSLPRFMARYSCLPMATVLVIPTRSLSLFVPSSIIRCANFSSPPSIPDGACGSGSRGQSIAA